PKDATDHLTPHQIIQEACRQAGNDATYVTDVGQHQMWAAQYLNHTKSRGFLTSGGLGTMGFGYGAAIGAQFGLGFDERVVMFTGDGSFHMNLNEACTAVSYEVPLITVIFNNQVLGMVRQWQTSFYGKRYSATDPHRKTDYVKLAAGFGLKGYHCETPAEFSAAFAEAMQSRTPVWIECLVGKDEKVLPMIPGGGDVTKIIME
ncbi:MAG: thiamine pyrophosphate-dependent enzyme, partial [Faecalibacterium sp.]